VFYNNKDHFEDFVSKQILVTRDWRNKQSQRFPDDPRNQKAAARLLQLESEIVVSDETWERLQPLLQDSTILKAISETNRDVAFRTYPTDFPAWLDCLHSNLIRN
jgi:hypothetical protein